MTSEKRDDPTNPKKALLSYLDELLQEAVPARAQAVESASPGEKTAPQEKTPLEEKTPRPVKQIDIAARLASPMRRQPASEMLPAASSAQRQPQPPKARAVALQEIAKLPLMPLKVAPPEMPPQPVAAPQVAPKVVEKPPAAPLAKVPVPVAPTPTETPDHQQGASRQGAGSPPKSPANGRPYWAQSAFECLLFKVAGLQMAVPLVLLGAIYKLDKPLNELPGGAAWFLGLLPQGDINLRVVDTARWVMAERYREGSAAGYHYVIRLDDSEWGLACDQVNQSFTLNPDDVKWRTQDGKRPWLAGTVVKYMCALVDVGNMAHLLGSK